jgi:hypothetical protein
MDAKQKKLKRVCRVLGKLIPCRELARAANVSKAHFAAEMGQVHCTILVDAKTETWTTTRTNDLGGCLGGFNLHANAVTWDLHALGLITKEEAGIFCEWLYQIDREQIKERRFRELLRFARENDYELRKTTR